MDCCRDDIPAVNCFGRDGLNKPPQTDRERFSAALLGAFAFLFIAGFSLTLIKLMG